MTFKFLNFLYLRRIIVSFFAFLGFLNISSLRANLSVAIVSMTTGRNITLTNGTIIEELPEFNWNSVEKGFILSSFFYGYCLTQVVGGNLASRFGGATVFGSGILFTAIFTVATPIVSKTFDLYGLVVLRFFEGLFEGVTYPSLCELMSQWAPPAERTRLFAFSLSGFAMGVTISFPIFGIIATYWGWSSTFYVPGIVALLWALVWFTFISDEPVGDPRISAEELEYLQSSIGRRKSKERKYPWKKILTSKPVIAMIVSEFCSAWGYYVLLTTLPTYINIVFHVDVEGAGLLSTVPYLTEWVMIVLSATCADLLRSKDNWSTTHVRKLYNTLSVIFHAGSILVAGYSTKMWVTLLFFTLYVTAGCFHSCSISVNPLDIARNHAGILMGLLNTMSSVAAGISPMVAGYIAKNNTAEEWRTVFQIICAIFLFGGVFYLIFGSGERQSWDCDTDIIKEKEEGNKEIEIVKKFNIA